MTAQTPSLAEVLEDAMDARLSSVWTAAVGRVVSFDASTCTANVQITTKTIHTREDGTSVATTLPILPNVPCVMPGSGENGLTVPVRKGDGCVVIFSTLPLDAWKFTTDRIVAPKLGSLHSLNNAIAIVGLRSLVGARASSMTPIVDEAVVLWAENELRLGHGSAADPVVRKSDLDAVVSAFNARLTGHTHESTAVGTPTLGGVVALGDATTPACSARVKVE